jgi:DNA-binding GntR family transcriptional regulator
LSQDVELRIRFTDPGLIRDRVVDALRDAIIAGRLKPRDVRALDEHAEIVGALRWRDLAAVQQGLHAHLMRFCGEITPFLPVESTLDPEPR